MAGLLTQDTTVLWVQSEGPNTEMILLGVGDDAAGFTGLALPATGVTPVYGKSTTGSPIVIATVKEAPGDLPAGTITIYDKATHNFLYDMWKNGCPIMVQKRVTICGTLDVPTIWDVNEAWVRGTLTSYTPGDGPTLEYGGQLLTAAGTLSFQTMIRLEQTVLSAVTGPAVTDMMAIDGIRAADCGECGTGYRGPDMHLYMGGADGEVYYSRNGVAGPWAAMDAAPFGGDSVDFVQVRPIARDYFRVFVATGVADAASDPRYAYTDVFFGDEGNATWVSGTLDDAALNSIITAALWARHGRLYQASEGDIFLSLTQGESIEDDVVYDGGGGAPALNGLTLSADGKNVWAWGAANAILVEENFQGGFVARSGPSGGTAFTALAQAADGRIYAGQGQLLYLSPDQAGSAGNWELLKDFGADKVVKGIQLLGGDQAGGGNSQLFRVYVDDSAGGNGEVWLTVDGRTFVRQTIRTNTGYNAFYGSIVDDGLALVVGDGGVMHQLS